MDKRAELDLRSTKLEPFFCVVNKQHHLRTKCKIVNILRKLFESKVTESISNKITKLSCFG